MSDAPVTHFSTTGWSPTACGIAKTSGLCGSADMADVTCLQCLTVLAGVQSDGGVRIDGVELREETDDEFRARIKGAVAEGQRGPFLRRLVDLAPSSRDA